MVAGKKKEEKRGRRRRLTPKKTERILQLKAEGVSNKEIAATVELPIGTIRRFLSQQEQADRDERGVHKITLELPKSVTAEIAARWVFAKHAQQQAVEKQHTRWITLELPLTITEEEAARRIRQPGPTFVEQTARGTHLVTLELPQTITETQAYLRVMLPELNYDQELQEARTGRKPLEIHF